ncbi:Uncharacterized protein dnm_030520 [Desulfonema magnum]|uniref:Uncharacterized protein n=1 Tax=Desulfonema magnum TaxID=45655 RepID=A0A975BKZ1_9BACT|nr:Uncharacterized protein dnm_030520 [Desulfonema magnum]
MFSCIKTSLVYGVTIQPLTTAVSVPAKSARKEVDRCF